MPDSSHTTASIAKAIADAGIEVELRGGGNIPVDRFDPADSASAGAITFFRGLAFADSWKAGNTSAALVSRRHADAYSLGTTVSRALLVVPDVDLATIAVLKLFAPPATPVPPGVHPSAVVDPSARLAPQVAVGPLCSVGPGATLACGATLLGSVHIGANATVGEESTLHPGVRLLDRCSIGSRCIIHCGTVIGADGFGYAPGPKGLIKIPHIGDVIIEDDVEIGANSCVDRAKIGSTRIGRGTKIDNLVQVGHNCRIGRFCILCGSTALSGSVTLEDGVILGGGVGIADGINIGAGAKVAARSGVMNDIPAGEDWWGYPAGNVKETRRNYAVLRHIADTIAELKKAVRRDSPGHD